MVICLPQRPQCRGRPSSSLTVGIEPENVDGHGGGRDLTHNPVSRANGPASERLTSSLTVARDLGNAGLHSGGPPLTRTEEVMGRPRHRVESQVSCPKPFRLATAAQSPGHRPSTCPEPVSEINVAQPTLPRVLRRSLHGTPAWLRQRLPPPTSNPSSRSTPSSAPAAIGCSPRPPAAPAATAPPTAKLAPGPAPPRRHPGRLETRPPRPLPPPPGRHHHQPGRARHQLPQPPGGDRDTTPGGKLVFHIFAVLAEFERDLIRERTAAGLAAARARGRRGDRPSVLTVARVRVLS
jgi:hypothetical protein